MALVLIFSSAARAQVDRSAAPKSVDVSFASMQLIPYSFRDEEGIVTGYFYEIAHVMLEDAGLEYELSLLPLKRMVVEIKRGQKDCVFVA